MDFGGGGFFGSGSKKTVTTTQQTTNNYVDETGVQVSGDESLGVGKAEQLQINMLDGDAFSEAVDFARDALELPGAAIDAVVDSSTEALKRGFDFSETLFGEAADFAGDFTNAQTERFADFARGIVSESMDRVSETVERSQESLGDTVTALNTIAGERATTDAQRMQDVMKWVIAGVVLLGVAMAMRK